MRCRALVTARTLVTLVACVALPQLQAGERDARARESGELIDRYCVGCHDQVEWQGGLALDLVTLDEVASDAAMWEKVVRKLRTGMMPPAGEPRPAAARLDRLATLLETRLDSVARAQPNPGAPGLRRLNRLEYANAIRDLLALDVDVSTLLPADDVSHGFDNIGDVLGISPSLIEGYVTAATKISRLALGDRVASAVQAEYRPPADLSQDRHLDGLPLGTRGGFVARHNFPLDAEYEFRVSPGGFNTLGSGETVREPRVDVTLDGTPAQVEDARRFRRRMSAGPHSIGAALVDEVRSAGVDDIYSVYAIRGGVQSIVIVGPFDPAGPGDTPSRRAVLTCIPTDAGEAAEEACARLILERLARRAYRRPLQGEGELETLLGFYRRGRAQGDFETGLQQALARLLVDPRFLFRFELRPEGAPGSEAWRVGDFELAARLSFFLWSSIPDEALLQAAGRGELTTAAGLEREVRRMLADPRADALVSSFAAQWLQLRALDAAEPDVRGFDANLRQSMRRETEMLVADVLHEDRSVLDLLRADFTFLDERLATHYGIGGVSGSYMRRVPLPRDSQRGGLLAQGSILTLTSVANRTSPVVRGTWIMENLLGAHAPQPPAGVETNLDRTADSGHAEPASLRRRLELHRSDPTCAACHRIMDPLGLALENYDLVGRWRTAEGTEAIDASGELVDGTRIAGPADLRAALLARSELFVTTLTEKLMTYALGRGLEYYDMPAVRGATREARREGYRVSALVLGIVRSVPFQSRVGPAGEAQEARLTAATSQQKEPP